MTAKGDYFPRRINDHVPNMQYAADVRFGGFGTIVIPAPAAADADGILDGVSIASAGSTTTFADAYTDDVMAKFGRNVTVVASGAATSKVTVYGKDYLGQPMVEELTLNGTTPVPGKKAFRYIDEIAFGATAATTIDVGWGNVLGLPYKSQKLISELVNKEVPSNAGTFVDGAATGHASSLTSDDPRGTYAPHSSQLPNGAREYELSFMHDTDNLHGDPHYYA